MEPLEMAQALSREFGGYVTGPHYLHNQRGAAGIGVSAQVITPNGRGVGIVYYADTPPPPSGELNVWGVEETGQRSPVSDSEPEPFRITAWCVHSGALPEGFEYGVTAERIKEALREIAALPPVPHRA